jgi:glycolate oxidase iron-sulfur subunit
MRAVRQTQANVIATANPGCLMQLQYGAQRDGMNIEVRYITDLLDESYSKE